MSKEIKKTMIFGSWKKQKGKLTESEFSPVASSKYGSTLLKKNVVAAPKNDDSGGDKCCCCCCSCSSSGGSAFEEETKR
jgi:hypothetical protein